MARRRRPSLSDWCRQAWFSAWRNELIEFLDDPANEVIGSNPHVAEQFDKLLASMGSSGVFEGLNNKQILQSVRNQLSFHVPELRDKPYTPKASKQNKPANIVTGKQIGRAHV